MPAESRNMEYTGRKNLKERAARRQAELELNPKLIPPPPSPITHHPSYTKMQPAPPLENLVAADPAGSEPVSAPAVAECQVTAVTLGVELEPPRVRLDVIGLGREAGPVDVEDRAEGDVLAAAVMVAAHADLAAVPGRQLQRPGRGEGEREEEDAGLHGGDLVLEGRVREGLGVGRGWDGAGYCCLMVGVGTGVFGS
jgi:hypothetical protein